MKTLHICKMVVKVLDAIGLNALCAKLKARFSACALDADVVHKSGNEVISGTKTFSSEISGTISGNAGTADAFSESKSVTLTGDVTGTASSTGGWSIAATLANSGVAANTYGSASQQTPANGGTFNVPYFTADAKGRITSAGTASVKMPDVIIPSGTRMLFQQSAAPTGWTKETGTGYNNIALRLTTGNIANKTNGKAFTTCMATGRGTANATQGGTISNTTAGGTVGNKALSVAMLASHNHNISTSGSSNGIWTYYHQLNASYGDGVAAITNWGNGVTIENTGSGSNHNHSFTGSEHGHTFTGSAHNHTVDLDINYIDCIVASKT